MSAIRLFQPSPHSGALLLSIRAEHAQRIFEGSKQFELRKVLPKDGFQRVFLYETKGTGVVGCFDVGEVIQAGLDDLWAAVGTAATTRGRFDSYFSTATIGYAIRVVNAIRFNKPLTLKALRDIEPKLTAPQSYYRLAPGDPLLRSLNRARQVALDSSPPPVTLRAIRENERAEYKRLVQRYVGASYDEIDASFSSYNLLVSDLGHDPAGFFTTTKEVLSIISAAGRTVGFTTLSYKGGDSVKSGPTILLPSYQNKGLGRAARSAIEARVRSKGARKIYCTCPDTAFPTIRYLLRSGMRVEAHLGLQYSLDHGELVFGKLLAADEIPSGQPAEFPRVIGRVVPADTLKHSELIRRFQEMFGSVWYPVTKKYARQIIQQATVGNRKRSAKPKHLVTLGRGKSPIAACVLLPKRGGAVKGLILRRTSHDVSLRHLINAAIDEARRLDKRKLYILHPLRDSLIVPLLQEIGFVAEGVLRAPYVPGQDVIVLARFV